MDRHSCTRGTPLSISLYLHTSTVRTRALSSLASICNLQGIPAAEELHFSVSLCLSTEWGTTVTALTTVINERLWQGYVFPVVTAFSVCSRGCQNAKSCAARCWFWLGPPWPLKQSQSVEENSTDVEVHLRYENEGPTIGIHVSLQTVLLGFFLSRHGHSSHPFWCCEAEFGAAVFTKAV